MRWTIGAMVWLGLTVSLAAQLPEAWRHWRYSAPIGAAAAAPDQLVSVIVPMPVTALARPDWTDLRVIDAGGTEVPFVLRARVGGKTVDRRTLPLLEPSSVAGSYQQAVVDMGANGVAHNSIELGIETDRNLLSWVEVAVSSDLVDWRVVRDRAPIYVLRADGMGEETEVSYPESVSRYVRLRVLDGSGTYRLISAELGYETSTVAEHVPSGIAFKASTGPEGQSVWTSEADATHLPLSRVEFETTRSSFFRSVSIETSDDGQRWEWVGRGNILRGTGGADDRAWLAVDFQETQAPYWRIAVDHRNDAAIADLTPRLLTTPRRVVVRQAPGESYRLLFGNPRASEPRYDLAQIVDTAALDLAAPAELGVIDENPGWVDPSPWTERYEAVLWVALVLAVLMLAGVALRTLRSAPA